MSHTFLLLHYILSSGTTRAIFAKSGKMLCSIPELIDLVKSGVKNSTATFISFWGMVSIPVAFLGFNPCISFFIQFHLENGNESFPLHETKMSRYCVFICNKLAWFS